MTEEKKEFNLPKKYVFLIIVLGVIFISASIIFFKVDFLNHYETKIIKKEENISDKLLKENKDIINNFYSDKKTEIRTINDSDHILGVKDGKLKIIYYNDFDAPFNENLFQVIDKIKEEFPDSSIAYRHFLMKSNPSGLSAALASECAGEQGKFWEMARALVDAKTNGKLNEDEFYFQAKELKLNYDDFKKCIDEKKYLDKIEKQMKEGESFGVSGVPTIFVNDIILPGSYPFEDFTDSSGRDRKGLKSVIERELKE